MLPKFSEDERRILKYRGNHGEERLGDPAAIDRAIWRASVNRGVNFQDLLKVISDSEEIFAQEREHPTPVAEMTEALKKASELRLVSFNQAVEDVLAILHEAFKTQPMDDQGVGLTEEETIANLNALEEFKANLGKPTGPPSDSPLSTDSATVAPETVI